MIFNIENLIPFPPSDFKGRKDACSYIESCARESMQNLLEETKKLKIYL